MIGNMEKIAVLQKIAIDGIPGGGIQVPNMTRPAPRGGGVCPTCGRPLNSGGNIGNSSGVNDDWWEKRIRGILGQKDSSNKVPERNPYRGTSPRDLLWRKPEAQGRYDRGREMWEDEMWRQYQNGHRGRYAL